MTLWFVTPAFQRFELSEVCFAQRRHVIDTLEANGIPARCVVVADDDNLDLARAQGFDTLKRDNEWLGRRFNDGIEYACQNGASRVVPIGSDSWIDPTYFLPLTTRQFTRTSVLYAAVTAERIAEIRVADTKGAGPYVIPRHLLKRSRFRPAKDEIHRGVDSSTVKGLRSVAWRYHDVHPFQYVGFRGEPHLTPYETLVSRWGVAEHRNPWPILARYYPAELVERAKAVMSAPMAAAA